VIEVVRGRLDAERGDELLAFWAEHDALPADEARNRLPEVVCLVTEGTAIAAVSSVVAADVPLIGGRRLWVYRRFAIGISTAVDDELLVTTFDALDAEHDPEGAGPIGMFVVVDPLTGPARGREAVQSSTGFLHAGYEPGGRRVRVRYFAGARIVL
jgi:hypothetical protein